ncbi:hypothetical protein D3C77_509900 [compost metagenome]
MGYLVAGIALVIGHRTAKQTDGDLHRHRQLAVFRPTAVTLDAVNTVGHAVAHTAITAVVTNGNGVVHLAVPPVIVA